MAFVNEYVSEEDDKKYGLEEIDKRYRKGHHRPDWTIDRDRNIYLRWMRAGREELWNHEYFTFYWKETLIEVELIQNGENINGGKRQTVWTLDHMTLPVELKEKKQDIIADLKDALRVFKDIGIRSTITNHNAVFEF